MDAVAATLVLFALAASAGIHAGIVPEHLREEPRLGIAFAVTVVVLLATGAAVSIRPSARPVAWIAALVLGSVIVAYIASRTTGIPFLDPDPEAVDAIGVLAVAIELVGVLCALWLAETDPSPTSAPFPQEVTR
jgi:hypothetical protein